jgi:hypothetical protein
MVMLISHFVHALDTIHEEKLLGCYVFFLTLFGLFVINISHGHFLASVCVQPFCLLSSGV